MADAANIHELVQQHPGIVIGGVVLVGTLILVARGGSGTKQSGTALGSGKSDTAVSADTLNNALADQRKLLEQEMQDWFDKYGYFPTLQELGTGEPGGPNPDPIGNPNPGTCAPGYHLSGGRCVPNSEPPQFCPEGYHSDGHGGCVLDHPGPLPRPIGGRGGGMDAPGDFYDMINAEYRYGRYSA